MENLKTSTIRKTTFTLLQNEIEEAIKNYLKSKNMPDVDQHMALDVRLTRDENNRFVMDVELNNYNKDCNIHEDVLPK